MDFKTLRDAALRKRAAAVLTPEAMQAAAPPPQDPAMAGGMPPADPAMAGGAPAAGGGQIPPEILQDQQFIQWMAQQGAAFDPQTGQFMAPDGSPVPPEMVMQAYQAYMAEMQGQGMAPAGGPAPQGGMPPAGGQLPPEIMQDQLFLQFMQEVVGVQLDPNSGMFIDPQSGQPLPPEIVMQAYQEFQQQMAAQGGQPGAGEPPAAGPEGQGAPAQEGAAIPPEIADQFQSMIDAAMQNYSAELDKKLETLMDKLDTVKMAIESMRDTDDKRTASDKSEAAAVRDELAAELTPTVKTASAKPAHTARKQAPRPVNMLDILANRR